MPFGHLRCVWVCSNLIDSVHFGEGKEHVSHSVIVMVDNEPFALKKSSQQSLPNFSSGVIWFGMYSLPEMQSGSYISLRPLSACELVWMEPQGPIANISCLVIKFT